MLKSNFSNICTTSPREIAFEIKRHKYIKAVRNKVRKMCSMTPACLFGLQRGHELGSSRCAHLSGRPPAAAPCLGHTLAHADRPPGHGSLPAGTHSQLLSPGLPTPQIGPGQALLKPAGSYCVPRVAWARGGPLSCPIGICLPSWAQSC